MRSPIRRRLFVGILPALTAAFLAGCTCPRGGTDEKMVLIGAVDDALTRGDQAALQGLMPTPDQLRDVRCTGERADHLRRNAAERAEGAQHMWAECGPLFAGSAPRRLALNYGSDRSPVGDAACPWQTWEKSELYYALGEDVVTVTLRSVSIDGRSLLTRLRCSRKREPASRWPFEPNCPGRWPTVTQAGGRCP